VYSIYFSFSLIILNTEPVISVVLCVITTLGIMFLFFMLLYVFDDWWFQFFRRLFVKDRRLTLGRSYLLSFERYGFEDGNLKKANTTIPIKIDPKGHIYRLFVGLVFNSKKDYETSLNNHDINDLLHKLEARMIKDKQEKGDMAGFRALVDEDIESNIDALERKDYFKNELSPEEQKLVINFMKETNTLAWDLFNINNILHSNHFIGFKIKNKIDKPWGVVIIDVLSQDRKNFLES